MIERWFKWQPVPSSTTLPERFDISAEFPPRNMQKNAANTQQLLITLRTYRLRISRTIPVLSLFPNNSGKRTCSNSQHIYTLTSRLANFSSASLRHSVIIISSRFKFVLSSRRKVSTLRVNVSSKYIEYAKIVIANFSSPRLYHSVIISSRFKFSLNPGTKGLDSSSKRFFQVYRAREDPNREIYLSNYLYCRCYS